MAGPATLFQVGDHASRPAADAGCVLYSCTDHDLVYRSDGSSWTTLITLVSGLSNPMTTAADIIVGGASGTPARLGIGSEGEVLKVASGVPAWATVGASDWDQSVAKSGDETVTNSSTFQDDDDLAITIGADEVWEFEAIIVYDATLSGDFKCDFVTSTGTCSAVFRYLGSDTTANAVNVSTGVRDSGVSNTTDITAGGTSGGTKRVLWIEGFFFAASTTMTITLRFAQNSAQSGESAIAKAGSLLRAKQIA